jgi:hypothetical protein
MPEGPATVLGGLPVIAVCTFGKDSDTPNGPGEYWAEVDTLHWRKRDGSKGAEVSLKVYDRLEKLDPYWQCNVTDQVSDWLTYQQGERGRESEMLQLEMLTCPTNAV